MRSGALRSWLLLAALAAFVWGCRPAPEGSELVSAPIIHIGQNEADPGLMETAILLVIRAPFETVRPYVSNPENIESYMAFAEQSRAEPFPGGPASDRLVKIRTTVVDVFGLSIPGKSLELRWHPLQSNESVFAIAFGQVSGAYAHLTGNIYAANLFDGSTAVMLRTTTRTGFVPEPVRERLARWHAEASIRKLTELLESQAS
jgi:hypothetical protein